MGLAEELKADQTNRGKAPEPKSAEGTHKPEEHFAIEAEAPDENPVELPQGNQVEKPQEAAPPKIRFPDGKEFASTEEALEYAKTIAIENLTAKAYEQGKQDAKPAEEPKPEEPQVDPRLKAIEDLLFTDPMKAINELLVVAKEEAQKELDQREAAKADALKVAQAKEEAFKSFYGKHTDLAEFRETVDYVIDRDMAELGKLSPEKALEEVAARTRKLLGLAKEASLPSKELSSKGAVLPGSTGSEGKGGGESTKVSALDFISQVRKHGKRN